MRKHKSIYQFLIALLVFSLIIPAGMVSAKGSYDVNDIKPTVGSLTIHKFEREPGAEDGEEGDGSADQSVPGDAVALPGVTYTVTQTHSYNPETDEWSEVTGGEQWTGTTGSDGTYTFPELPLGRYTVQETAGPPHVNLNPDVFMVDIPMTSKDGETVNYDVHIYPKNETIRGAVELTKIDGDTELPIAGVGFELYNDDGTQVDLGDPNVAYTNGDGKIYVSGLAYGDYFFKEVDELGGYVRGDQRIEFSIEESGLVDEAGEHLGTVVQVSATNFVEPEIVKEIDEGAVNRGEEVTYTLTVDLPGDIASYNSFVITDLLDDDLHFIPLSETISVDGAFEFTQDNQLLKWTVTDFGALDGVQSVTITFTALVSNEAEPNIDINNVASIEFENKHGYGGERDSNGVVVTPTAGNVTVIKLDGNTEKSLAGAEFELRKSDGKVYKGTTDDTGEIIFENVDYGEYLLVETKAPEGYNKLRNPLEITVNSDQHDETYSIKNFKSGWQLPKTGGIGTIPFTILGLLIMGAAVYLYVRRRNQIA